MDEEHWQFFDLSSTTFYSTLLMVHKLNLLVDFSFSPNYLICYLRGLQVQFDMKSSKSCFLSEGAKDRKVKKMKCTFVRLERLCALVYLGLFQYSCKSVCSKQNQPETKCEGFSRQPSNEGKKCYLEIKHNPVLSDNGGFGFL